MNNSGSIILIFIIVTLAGCKKNDERTRQLTDEGIAPYELSDDEKYILQSFGMIGKSQIISFRASNKVKSLMINVYKLENGESWSSIGSNGIGIERGSDEQLKGNITMLIKDKYAFDFNINATGRFTFKTEEIIIDNELIASTIVFLQEFQQIEINKEIPIALMVYDSSTSMKTYSLQDFFTPSKFKEKDLVQVVTITFSDKEL